MRGRGAGCRRAQPRSLTAQSRRPPAGPGCRGPGAQARWLRSRRSAALRPGPASACDARRAGREQDTQGERGAGARRGRGRWTGRSGAAGPATCVPRRCPHSRRRSSRFASPASEKTPEVAVPGDGRDTRSPGGAGPPRGHCATADPEGPRAPPDSLLRASPVPSAACGRDPLGNAAFTGLSSEGAARPPRPPHCAGPSWPPETAPRVTKIPAVTSSAVSSGGRCAARPWQELSPGWVRVLTVSRGPKVSRGPQGHEDKGLGTCKCLCNEVTFNHLPLSCIPQNRSMEIRTRPPLKQPKYKQDPPPKQSAETTYNT